MSNEGRNPSYNNPIVPIKLGDTTHHMEYHLAGMQWLLEQTRDDKFIIKSMGEGGKLTESFTMGIDMLRGLDLETVFRTPRYLGLMVQAGFIELDDKDTPSPTLGLGYIMRRINRSNLAYVQGCILQAMDLYLGPADESDKSSKLEPQPTDPTERRG